MASFVRVALAALLAVAMLVAVPGAPAAASCASTDLAAQVARADVVAFGTVTSIRMTLVAAGGVVTFRPERVLKGSLTRSVQVYLGPTHGGAVSSVDYQAAPPQQHTLYLRDAQDGSFETDACAGSHAGAPTADEERILGTGTLVSTAEAGDLTWVLVVLVAALIVAIVMIAFVRRRRLAAS